MNVQRGFTLIEIIAVLAIGSLLLIAGAEITEQKTQDIKDQNTAQYQAMFNSAAVRYVQSIASTITPSNTQDQPRVVRFSDIQTAGFIPATFATATTNPYRQTPCVLVSLSATNPNEVNALVVTEGGEAIKEGRLPAIATLIGSSGGYIGSNSPNNATGTYGKWNQPIPTGNTYTCSGTRATSGHIASLLYLDKNNLVQNYLYRNEVPGHPEANSINTPLIMNATADLASPTCPAVGAIARTADSSLVTCANINEGWKPVGSKYWKDALETKPMLDATQCDAQNVGETRIVKIPTVGSGPRAYTCNGTSWVPLSLDDNGSLNVPGTLTVSKLSGDLEVTKIRNRGDLCQLPDKPGSLARDSTGLMLSCQNVNGTTTWQKALGESGGYKGLYDYLEGKEISCAAYSSATRRHVYGYLKIENGVWYNRALYTGLRDSGDVPFAENVSANYANYIVSSKFNLLANEPFITVTVSYGVTVFNSGTTCGIGCTSTQQRVESTCTASFPPPN